MIIGRNEQQYLLQLARKCLTYFFESGEEYMLAAEEVPEELRVERATFVTLTKFGQLRGCIGRLEASQMLYLDVMEHSYAAAFSDYRFDPLVLEEMKDIRIEISILSEPEVLKYTDASDLIVLLEQQRPGVILSDGLRQATFLPQVWEELSDPKAFLDQLCLKAGLDKNAWEKGHLQISTYTVQNFIEP